MNRRKFLACSAATLGVAALGTTAMVFEDSSSFIPGLLHKLVGEFSMDEAQQKRFVDSIENRYGSEKLAALIGLYRIRSGTGLGVSYTNSKVDRFERMLLTDFMVSTDYLKKQHEKNPRVNFLGHFPCNNPYARYTA
ncbi:MAG TPA: hypothetical protein ENI17_08310 [Pseudomonas xinjiangensis]|uniref:Tat (Twin-arginine translocation) pathway signal sequence n=2 Tax=root TaxID=1 RepID=A0A7V1FSM5_9GAMM|nr:hypothetical protein [Halopseudomonas xinjiangensis]HEC47617.1 hypothetical protein [Halopseudomonas xinjiangensis]